MTIAVYAQSETEYRFNVGFRYSPIKNLKLYLMPELRVDAGGVDKALAEVEAKYAVLKILDMGVSYKAIFNFKNSGVTELSHRVAVYSEVEHKIKRFRPSLRAMFVNYDEDEDASNFLRGRVKLEYNVRNVRIDPYVTAELYYQLSDGNVYKMRYAVGTDWRISKHHAVGLEYKLDQYTNSDKIKHIVGLGYTFKF